MNPLDQLTLAPTPRTDAIAIRGASTAFPRASYFVDSDFARILERELAGACSLNALACRKWDAAERELTAEREKVRVLREALDNLRDEQNGAPLCTREEEWKEAMEKADAALAATKEGTP
jgi:hypothetical protein